jgi:predicted restriction endonuclease
MREEFRGITIHSFSLEELYNLPEIDPALILYKAIYQTKYGGIGTFEDYAYNADEFIDRTIDHAGEKLVRFLEVYVKVDNQSGYFEEQLKLGRFNAKLDKRPDHIISIQVSLRYKILKRDEYKCRICGRSANDGARLEVDHIFPRAKGGKDNPENLWTLCFDCNRGKGTQDL